MYPSVYDAMYPNHTIRDSLKRFSPMEMERVQNIEAEVQDILMEESGINTHIDTMVPVMKKEELLHERKTLLKKAQDKVLDLVFKEEVFVYANDENTFVSIPAHQFLAGTVNWNANSFSIGTFNTSRIRIYEKNIEHFHTVEKMKVDYKAERSPITPTSPHSSSKGGRPSYKNTIKKEYLNLKHNGKIDFSRTKKEIYRQISENVALDLNIPIPKGGRSWPKGLGLKAIENAVGDLVDV